MFEEQQENQEKKDGTSKIFPHERKDILKEGDYI